MEINYFSAQLNTEDYNAVIRNGVWDKYMLCSLRNLKIYIKHDKLNLVLSVP